MTDYISIGVRILCVRAYLDKESDNPGVSHPFPDARCCPPHLPGVGRGLKSVIYVWNSSELVTLTKALSMCNVINTVFPELVILAKSYTVSNAANTLFPYQTSGTSPWRR